MSALKVVRRKRFVDGAALLKYCETHHNEELSIPCKKLDYLVWDHGISTRVAGRRSGQLEVLTYLEKLFLTWAEQVKAYHPSANAYIEASAMVTALLAEVNCITTNQDDNAALRHATANAARQRILQPQVMVRVPAERGLRLCAN
jgi:hypothetical protein